MVILLGSTAWVPPKKNILVRLYARTHFSMLLKIAVIGCRVLVAVVVIMKRTEMTAALIAGT